MGSSRSEQDGGAVTANSAQRQPRLAEGTVLCHATSPGFQQRSPSLGEPCPSRQAGSSSSSVLGPGGGGGSYAAQLQYAGWGTISFIHPPPLWNPGSGSFPFTRSHLWLLKQQMAHRETPGGLTYVKPAWGYRYLSARVGWHREDQANARWQGCTAGWAGDRLAAGARSTAETPQNSQRFWPNQQSTNTWKPLTCRGVLPESTCRGLTSPSFSEMPKDDQVSAFPDTHRYKRIRKHYLDLVDSFNVQSTLRIFKEHTSQTLHIQAWCHKVVSLKQTFFWVLDRSILLNCLNFAS